MKKENGNRELKQQVGQAAARLVKNGMICGIGTGSTIAFFIEALGRRIREEGLNVNGVPTSYQSRLLCREYEVPIIAAEDCSELDLAVDGADEVDEDLNAIKGGGAAHTREKIIAAMARELVLIIDESKLVPRLGSTFPVPIEVIPAAVKYVTNIVIGLGGDPLLRMGVNKDGPVVTDNGQFIVDVRFSEEVDLRQIDRQLHCIPGVVETGLFLDLASQVLIGTGSGITVKTTQSGKKPILLKPDIEN